VCRRQYEEFLRQLTSKMDAEKEQKAARMGESCGGGWRAAGEGQRVEGGGGRMEGGGSREEGRGKKGGGVEG